MLRNALISQKPILRFAIKNAAVFSTWPNELILFVINIVRFMKQKCDVIASVITETLKYSTHFRVTSFSADEAKK